MAGRSDSGRLSPFGHSGPADILRRQCGQRGRSEAGIGGLCGRLRPRRYAIEPLRRGRGPPVMQERALGAPSPWPAPGCTTPSARAANAPARRGSIHLDPLGLVGAVAAPCVAASARSRVAIDPAAAVGADPDLIVTTDPRFHARAALPAPWADSRRCAGRVHLAPAPVLSRFDRPRPLNRIVGLRWLARLCYGDGYRGDRDREARAFHRLFYRAVPPPDFRAG